MSEGYVPGEELRIHDIVIDEMDNVRGRVVEILEDGVSILWVDKPAPIVYQHEHYYTFVRLTYDHDLKDIS